MEIRKAIEIYVRIPDAVNEDDAENILYDALDSGLMNSRYNIESWNMKYIPDFDDFAYPVESSTSINGSEENYELSPELSSIIDDYVGHKFKNPTTGWTGSCDAYLRELSDGAILVSFVFGENESEPDEFTYNPETGKSVFYPYNGTIVHTNSLDELRNAMRKEYSYLRRIDK